MLDFWKALVSRSSLLYLIVGVIFVLLGGTSGLTTSTFSINIGEKWMGLLLLGLGIVLIGVALFFEFRNTELDLRSSRFDNSAELFKYVKNRINKAKKRVDDITWGPAGTELMSKEDLNEFDEYVDAIVQACTNNKSLEYREIMGIPPASRIERMTKVLSKDLYNYHLRYFEFDLDKLPPLLSFIIIDGKEVIVAFYRAPHLPPEGEVRLVIKNKGVVNLFQDYYETIWHKAKIVKDRNKVETGEIEELKGRYGKA